MSLKSAMTAVISARMTSAAAQSAARAKAEQARLKANAPHVVTYFHQVDDPYSHLAAQALRLFVDRYDVALHAHLVSPPPDWATPERAMLNAYARRDAALVAKQAGFAFDDAGGALDPAQVEGAQSAIAVHVDPVAFLDAAIGAGAALWRGAGKAKALTPHARARIETGTALRQQRGHFLGATIEYGGEWYWGLDRLHYMEARLQALQAGAGGLIFPLPTSPQGSGKAGGVLDYFLSFRSPYTYLAAERAKALADAYGAELRLRFVLPMVMRGMAVPPMKSRYFTLDCAREARRLGIPFGRIADPLGKPVERGYSLVAWAQAEGRGFEYCLSFMRRVWSEGVDAGQTRGMQRIVEAAGLNWQSAQKHLDSQGWRSEAEANRRDMIALGLWGVPSLRYEDVAVWGQDRLWAIEGAMQNRAQQRALG